ncbi:hypothetical protein [Mycolicibacterium brisbanense]|uniref:Uncharacterized protein n=1 Tax=Mycolicibacterium brisbanense TaxID=146020 RepID=A0A117I5U9_9MYCO|nr:hypothetical protein [Mycolicibacterium brisbanense]MCV7160618.1 hypothetical protein [Mycolicibacterium brisbanense]GAS89073.1 uncharacterized protein RMCB_3169 [Mycolicibacterium brisbanense]
MDDPNDIAAAFAATADNVVEQARAEAVDAFSKINNPAQNAPAYTAGDALKTMSALAKIALTGSIEMAQTALDVRPNPGVLILADYVSTVLSQGVQQAADVATNAATLIDQNAYGKDQWVESAIKLTTIAYLRGSEIFQTVAAGPAQFADPVVKETFTLADADVDPTKDRTLTLTTLQLGGPNTTKPVAGWRVSFEPVNAVLPAGANQFTLVVSGAGLASGLYVGKVELTGGSVADVTVDVAINL